ncbi:MAG: uroporphyrinogen-III decarboxylase-like protein [Bryobacterales bacterium]|nr:uroporphyrinogen-III decarboxylase-like protein [Bryobacterales bacterium]
MMTPRERWEATMGGSKPDRPACDYWGTAEITDRLKTDLGCGSDRALWERLGVDKLVQLTPYHPRATEQTWHLQSFFSVWHIGTRLVPYADGLGYYEEAVAHPLAGAECVADVEGFDWPDPEEWDVSGLRAQSDEWREYPQLAGGCEIFYLYCRLRGMEQALEDLAMNPEIADAILSRIGEIDRALTKRILDVAGDRLLFSYVAEDLGTQESLLMSPRMFRRFLRPHILKMIELVHSYGVKVFHHDDGAMRPMLGELIEMGIDLLNPIQWRCKGMDREGLARDFGDRIVFHGAVDNQRTLPFGSVDDVRREVRENLSIFAGARGYVVAPCHNLQANTPTENVVAMYEAAREGK